VPVADVLERLDKRDASNAQSAGPQEPMNSFNKSSALVAVEEGPAGGTPYGKSGAMSTPGSKPTASGAAGKPRNAKDNMEAPPSLNMLLQNLELANEDPAAAMEHLKALSDDVDVLVANVLMLDQYFAPDQDEAEIEFHIETFMQNT